MTSLRFRNLNVDPFEPVANWPTEGVMAALERGGLSDWRRLTAAVRADPWGPVARRLEDALNATDAYGVGTLMRSMLGEAREASAASERAEVASRVRQLLETSGLDRAAFAERIGTSTSRLSTYLNGKVAPASTLLVRMERVAGMAASDARGESLP